MTRSFHVIVGLEGAQLGHHGEGAGPQGDTAAAEEGTSRGGGRKCEGGRRDEGWRDERGVEGVF